MYIYIYTHTHIGAVTRRGWVGLSVFRDVARRKTRGG